MSAEIVQVEESGAVVWTAERVDLAKRSVCPPGTTDDACLLKKNGSSRTGSLPISRACSA